VRLHLCQWPGRRAVTGHAHGASRLRRVAPGASGAEGITLYTIMRSAVMRRQTLLGCGLALVVILLILPGSPPAQTTTPRQLDRLKVALQLEREQNDPILITVVYAAQYAPVYEALVEEDPWHNFVPMLATDWSMSPDGKTWTFTLRKGVQWH